MNKRKICIVLTLVSLCMTAMCVEPRTEEIPLSGGPEILFKSINGLLSSGVLKKQKSNIRETAQALKGAPFSIKEGERKAIILQAYLADPWTMPVHKEIEGVDPPNPYPWGARWQVEFQFDEREILTKIQWSFMKGKFD